MPKVISWQLANVIRASSLLYFSFGENKDPEAVWWFEGHFIRATKSPRHKRHEFLLTQ